MHLDFYAAFDLYYDCKSVCLMISSMTERVEKAQMISLSLLIFTVISGVSEYMVLGTQGAGKAFLLVVLYCCVFV